MAANRSSLLTFALILVGVLLVYYPTINLAFLFDDIPNIVHNNALTSLEPTWGSIWHAIWSSDSGPLHRPVSMLSFTLNTLSTGLNDPAPFRVTNIALHALTAIFLFLFFALSLRTLGFRTKQAQLISAICALIWALHPLQVSTVAYIVQRMTILSSLFMVIGLYLYARGRIKLIQARPGQISYLLMSVTIAPILAVLSKENGVLIFPYIIITELLIFRFRARRSNQTLMIKRSTFSLIGIGVALAIFYLALHFDGIAGGYSRREFTLFERLMTEARIVCTYLMLIVVPTISNMGLFWDHVEISRGLLAPPETTLSLLLITFLLGTAIRYSSRFPLYTFAVLWFFASHLIESTIIALELAYEHRNYLAVAGVWFGIIGTAASAPPRLMPTSTRVLACASVMAAIVGSGFVRASTWTDKATFALYQTLHHPNSARSHFHLAGIYAERSQSAKDPARLINIELASREYHRAVERSPSMAAGWITWLYLYESHDLPVPDNVVAGALAAYRDYPVRAGSVNALDLLLRCYKVGVCNPEHRYFLHFSVTALENEQSSAGYRALILSHMARYAAAVIGDLESAVKYGRMSMAINDDNWGIRLRLIKWLLQRSHIDQAAAAVAEAKEAAGANAFSAELGHFAQIIDTVQERRTHPDTDVATTRRAQ